MGTGKGEGAVSRRKRLVVTVVRTPFVYAVFQSPGDAGCHGIAAQYVGSILPTVSGRTFDSAEFQGYIGHQRQMFQQVVGSVAVSLLCRCRESGQKQYEEQYFDGHEAKGI